MSWEHGPELEQLKDESLDGELGGGVLGGHILRLLQLRLWSQCSFMGLGWSPLTPHPTFMAVHTDGGGGRPPAGTGVSCLHLPSRGHLGCWEGL